MKWLRTIVLFDKGGVLSEKDWRDFHESYCRCIAKIDHPVGSGSLKLRRKFKPADGQWRRNGVNFLKHRFLGHMKADEGWKPEGEVDLSADRKQPPLRLYPSLNSYQEPITSNFGGFDFVTHGNDGSKVAIEWETGNISSSHRSMNKLTIALKAGIIDIGVLIVPSRALYDHLTDRIGNINELSGYLSMWADAGATIDRGLLAITVVEHDELTDDHDFPFLPRGDDGRAKEGRSKQTKV
jgi:hypothetical protein